MRGTLPGKTASANQVLRLVPTDGSVFSVQEYTDRYAHLLETEESEFLFAARDWLCGALDIPSTFRFPWKVAANFDGGEGQFLEARASGARSVILDGNCISLKGCRPRPGRFPRTSVSFGESRIVNEFVPFGVMTARAVIREILGYSYCRRHNIPIAGIPMAVFAYDGANESGSFCLLSRLIATRRAESCLRWPAATVFDLIDPSAQSGHLTMGSEIPLSGLNGQWYANEKARWLSHLHFGGAFRGLQNNNPGNDVIDFSGERPRFFFCDFESFRFATPPSTPSASFMEDFALHCVLEVVQGSLPILHFVQAPITLSAQEAAGCVGRAYRQRSSLWKAYHRRAQLWAERRSWNWSALDEAFGRAFESEAFLDASRATIMSGHALQRHRHAERFEYIPHE